MIYLKVNTTDDFIKAITYYQDEDILEIKVLMPRILKIVSKMSEFDQILFHYIFILKLSNTEIAERLKINSKRLGNIEARILNYIQEAFNPDIKLERISLQKEATRKNKRNWARLNRNNDDMNKRTKEEIDIERAMLLNYINNNVEQLSLKELKRILLVIQRYYEKNNNLKR